MRTHEHVLVIKLVDIVRDKEDYPYIIMEKYENSLLDLIKNRTLNESKIIRIFTMICVSLFSIHNKGIIHRDMKPHNVLIKLIEERLVCVITDFGVAKNPKFQYTTTVKGQSDAYAS